MTTIFKLAGLNSDDYAYVNNANQELIYEAANQYITMAVERSNLALASFVEAITTNFKERYKLPASGRMQRTNEEGVGAAVTPYNGWDVAYPLHNFTDKLAISDVDSAYLTPVDLDNHVNGIVTRWHNARLFEILYALFNNTQKAFTDKRHGVLTVERLAAGDAGVLYPPLEGATAEATDNHYLGTNYLASAINDSNNPIKTLVTELVEHGTNRTEDIPCVVFIHGDQQDVVGALGNFVPYIPPSRIRPGMDTDTVLMPVRMVPGKIIGYLRGYAWISVWPEIPSSYMLAVNLAAPAPVKQRVDPSGTNLGSGGLLMLPTERRGVLTFDDWRARFGMGVGNRLGGAVIDMSNADSDYDIPTKYV